ncbi:MAG: CrcB family protein [Micrococcales bacterium]|nr:CrcB family protein [Micrococcales bacterium]
MHLRPAALTLVGVGGVAGTAAREGVGVLLPGLGALPLATLAVNLSGAFALGLLLESLARHGDDRGRRRSLRLLLGTGFLGGYTTYSALSEDSARLLLEGDLLVGIAYPVATLLLGALASLLGIRVASNVRGRGAR